jgi:mannose-1-phosphate guanylyltransferase/mannose-6-phosphate isomerase
LVSVMKTVINPVIICGGSGTRLWPLSRFGFPKQFLTLLGEDSLFQQSVLRLQNLASSTINFDKTFIVANRDNRFLVLDQLKNKSEISTELLLEPEGRGTAAALTFAALRAVENEGDSILVVTHTCRSCN